MASNTRYRYGFDVYNEVLSPPPKASLADGVLIRIRQAISSGMLAPGERLNEKKLAERLDVSRGPIREALMQLEREGFVVKHRNRGTFVARLSREDVEEVYSLRLALERLAVSEAIRKAGSELIATLQSAVDDMAARDEHGPDLTEQQAAEWDIQFHDLIFQAARHRRLSDCWSDLRPQVYLFLLSRNVANPDFREYAVASHQQVVDAIRSGDVDRARKVVEEHMRAAYERVLHDYESRTTRQRPVTGA